MESQPIGIAWPQPSSRAANGGRSRLPTDGRARPRCHGDVSSITKAKQAAIRSILPVQARSDSNRSPLPLLHQIDAPDFGQLMRVQGFAVPRAFLTHFSSVEFAGTTGGSQVTYGPRPKEHPRRKSRSSWGLRWPKGRLCSELLTSLLRFNDTFVHVTDPTGSETIVRSHAAMKSEGRTRDESSALGPLSRPRQDCADTLQKLASNSLHVRIRATGGNRTTNRRGAPPRGRPRPHPAKGGAEGDDACNVVETTDRLVFWAAVGGDLPMPVSSGRLSDWRTRSARSSLRFKGAHHHQGVEQKLAFQGGKTDVEVDVSAPALRIPWDISGLITLAHVANSAAATSATDAPTVNRPKRSLRLHGFVVVNTVVKPWSALLTSETQLWLSSNWAFALIGLGRWAEALQLDVDW
uniref:Telomerase catalytic subunit n=1 Tax=Macrostomum lignano TaxID=282301 RepID=A0A1I8FIQ8_9PLAT